MTDYLFDGAVGLTGGASGNLDAITGTSLMDGDVYFTVHNGSLYLHKVNATLGGVENSPSLIVPDTDAGSKRLFLMGVGAFTYDYVFFPIGDAIDGTTAPATIATQSSSGTGKVKTRGFDSTSAEDVRYVWQVPANLDPTYGVLFKVHVLVTSATAPSNKGIVFDLSGFCSGHGDTFNGTFGTVVQSSKTAITESQWDVLQTEWSSAVTITDLAPGEVAFLKFARNPGHASDDYAVDADVIGITLQYRCILGLGIA